jgi:hypothetical protein
LLKFHKQNGFACPAKALDAKHAITRENYTPIAWKKKFPKVY